MESKKTSTRKPRTLLTARDISILSLAARFRFITADEVKTRFYNGSNTFNHFTRLKKLVHAGFLTQIVGDHAMKLGYRITRKGIHYLPSEDLKCHALSIRRNAYRTGFDHDKLLLKIQDVFESSPLVSQFSGEHEVRQLLASRHGKKENPKEGYKVPDSLFYLTTRKTSLTVAVELELSAKSKARYARIFRQVLISPDFQTVFYVVKNDQMKALMKQLLNEARTKDLVIQTATRKNSVYFATLNDLLEKKRDAVFEGQDSSFTLNALAES